MYEIVAHMISSLAAIIIIFGVLALLISLVDLELLSNLDELIYLTHSL